MVCYLIRARIDSISLLFQKQTNLLLIRPLTNFTQKSAPSRIVLLSSLGHQYANMDWDNLGREKKYDPMTSYANSKLANVLHGVELSKRLEGLFRNPRKIRAFGYQTCFPTPCFCFPNCLASEGVKELYPAVTNCQQNRIKMHER